MCTFNNATCEFRQGRILYNRTMPITIKQFDILLKNIKKEIAVELLIL